MGILLLAISSCGLGGSDKSTLKFSSPEAKKVTSPVETKTDEPTPAHVEKDQTYLTIKTKLFDNSCTKCHNPDKPKRLDLTNRELILENFDDIIYRMTDAFDMGFDYMPPKGDPVSPEIIKELKAWKADMTYLNIQKTLFEASCTKCHNPTNARRLDLTSKEVILKNYDKILYRMTDAFEEMNRPMPPAGKGERVSEKLVEEFKKWKESLP